MSTANVPFGACGSAEHLMPAGHVAPFEAVTAAMFEEPSSSAWR